VPRVAILSAVETVTAKIPSAIDAAALCKMADRDQITGELLDEPLAFDSAIDKEAAKIKGIKSVVAGQAQILVVPDLEAGNMLAKNLTFLAKADSAGIVLGARVPIILTSRADSLRARWHPARSRCSAPTPAVALQPLWRRNCHGCRRLDGGPFIIAEFVAHDSRLRFRSLSHISGSAINPPWPMALPG
jgi:hypothetical protein